MTPIGFHVTMRLADDRVIAPSRAARRRIARLILAHGEAFSLLAFRVVDTHIHLLLLCDRAAAAELARRIALAIHRALAPGAPFERARVRPFNDGAHLRSAFDYVLRQHVRHGVAHDPRHDGSVLPDLLGLRVGGLPLALRVREHLSRVTRADLLAHLGVPSLDEAMTLEGLAEGTSAAFGLADLDAADEITVAARAAAVHALRGAHLGEVAAALGVNLRTAQRALLRDVPAAHVRAVRLQLRLGLHLAVVPAAAELAALV